MKYIKQLDGLRAIAVILVIIGHSGLYTSIDVLHRFPKGSLGVNIFFVLSGFLITRILLENKQEGGNKLGLIKNFVVRRSLRIFPIYYITITAVFIWARFTYEAYTEHAISYYTYTSNILYYLTGEWDGMLSHLWTLAAEEQFYLIWPWIMLYAGRKTLLWLIPVFIAIGTFSPFLLPNSDFAPLLTTSCLDAFGAGALLSWVCVYKPEWGGKFVRCSGIVAVVAFALVMVYLLGVKDNLYDYVNRRTVHSAIAVWVIAVIVFGKVNPFVNTILSNKALIFIGKISYGIYLFHNLLPTAIAWLVGEHAFEVIPQLVRNEVIFVVETSLLILISWLSWKFIESPINNLKSRFEYSS